MTEPAPRSMAHAIALVAIDVIENADEPEDYPQLVDVVLHVRNVLRLPEDPPELGAYPIDDDGTTLAQAYRMLLTVST